MQKLTLASLYTLAIFVYISNSATALHHMLLAVPALYFSFKYLKSCKVFISNSHMFLFFLICWSIISTVGNLYIGGDSIVNIRNLLKLKYLLLPLLGTYAVIEMLNHIKKEQLIKIIKVFLIFTTIASLAGLIAYLTGFHILKWKFGSFKRASGSYGMVLSYAYSISILCSALLSLIVHTWKNIKIFNKKTILVIIAINLLGLYFSLARGALLSFIVTLPFLFYFKNKKIFWKLTSVGVLLSAIVISISLTDTSINFYRMNQKESDAHRITLYKTAIHTAANNPFLGIGYRNFEANCSFLKHKYGVEGDFCGHAHSNYLSQLTETGIVGLILFMLFLFSWFRELANSELILPLVITPALANFAFSGLFQNTFSDSEISFFIMGSFMLITAVLYNEKQMK